jgi:hypothetical protein
MQKWIPKEAYSLPVNHSHFWKYVSSNIFTQSWQQNHQESTTDSHYSWKTWFWHDHVSLNHSTWDSSNMPFLVIGLLPSWKMYLLTTLIMYCLVILVLSALNLGKNIWLKRCTIQKKKMCCNYYFDFCRTQIWTVRFILAKQVLYPEIHFQSILLCLLWRVLEVARITRMSHQCLTIITSYKE